MILKDDKAKAFATLLYNVNQDFKNTKNDSTYTIEGGVFYSFHQSNLVQLVGYANPNPKKGIADDDIHKLNGSVHGKDLFAFISKYKKNINKFVLKEGYFKIGTDIPEVSYKSGNIKDSQDLVLYKTFDKDAIQKFDKVKVKKTFNKEDIEKIKGSQYPILFNEKGIKLRLTFKLFIGLKVTTALSMKISKSKKKDLYLVDITSGQKDYTSIGYFVINNY